MDKNLPARPNLDHLRRQAKTLLASLESGDRDALATILQHLPAAESLSAEQVGKMQLRLADAQSAIARKNGFASWPQLARHVQQLRALEGTWAFASLEIDGTTMPAAALTSSKILIDGDRFRCESPEANYEGVFNIDVEAQPHKIEIEFVEGPEAGNWNFGIFRVEGERLEICLDLNGKPSPNEFCTFPGSGQAYEILARISASRPPAVTGGTPTVPRDAPPAADPQGFEFVSSPTLTQLEGNWMADKLVRDGQELPAMMCQTGHRSAKDNEVKIHFGGQLMIHALVRVNESTTPIRIDYYHLAGMTKGAIQHGIFQWRDDVACFCMAAPGSDYPSDFTSPPGSGRTLSHWRRSGQGSHG